MNDKLILIGLVVLCSHLEETHSRQVLRPNQRFGILKPAKSRLVSSSPALDYQEKSEALENDDVEDDVRAKRKVVHLQRTVIPFSKLAELKENVDNKKNLVKTIERGASFVEAVRRMLGSLIPRTDEDEELRSLTSGLRRDSVKDGLGFISGSVENLDNQRFFEDIEAEIFKFHSIPREGEEIRRFQLRIHERIKSYIGLNEVILEHAEVSDEEESR